MRKFLVAAILGFVVVAAVPSIANAVVYIYPGGDLNDLRHQNWYRWGVNWTHPGETIVDAVLSIDNIYDWRYETDVLNIHLLDWAPLGVTSGYDNQNPTDYFLGQGPLIVSWSDPYGEPSEAHDLSWSMKDVGLLDTFRTYISDGRAGFGFDPDCHYFNRGVTLEIITEPVPEPGTLALFGFGLATGAAAYRKRRARKA